MKWKKYYGESVNDASEELNGLEKPIKIIDIDEPDYPASDSWDKDAENIDFLIDEYIDDQADRFFTNGVIPEDEEKEMRDKVRAVRIRFDYWCDEDNEYDERDALFIINTDGWLCNVDWRGYGAYYSIEEWDYLVDAVFEYAGIKFHGYNVPEN